MRVSRRSCPARSSSINRPRLTRVRVVSGGRNRVAGAAGVGVRVEYRPEAAYRPEVVYRLEAAYLLEAVYRPEVVYRPVYPPLRLTAGSGGSGRSSTIRPCRS